MARCYNCGKEVEDGLGYWVDQGFICRICADALDFVFCIKCGRRFRVEDMIEWEDKYYCKNCVQIKKPIVRLKPLTRLGGGAGAAISRKVAVRKAAKEMDPNMFKDLKKAIKREEDAETGEKFKDLEDEIKGETKEIDEKDEDIDSLDELKELQDRLREQKEKKKKQDNDDTEQ